MQVAKKKYKRLSTFLIKMLFFHVFFSELFRF